MMDRTQLRTSDEEVAAEFGKVLTLMQTVFTKPGFSRRMAEASVMGLNWIQALEHAAKSSTGEGFSSAS